MFHKPNHGQASNASHSRGSVGSGAAGMHGSEMPEPELTDDMALTQQRETVRKEALNFIEKLKERMEQRLSLIRSPDARSNYAHHHNNASGAVGAASRDQS